MAISSEKIQIIRERVDIVRVIGAHVSLRKKGQRHVGLCPFHAEKTPSFSVSADKGLYYCFGCHAGGDVYSFLMRHQGVGFSDAVRMLAKEAGVEVDPEPEHQARKRRELEELAHINEYAQAFFAHALTQPEAAKARDYLHQRQIPAEQAKQRQLGFGGKAGALLAYLDAKKVSRERAIRAGFLSEDGSRCLFDGRVTFAIFDDENRLAGFGGRRLGEGPGPKYINTRESPLFAKSRLMYGWETARDAIRRSARVVVVEGYTDVLACQRAGIGEAVAALGTAFTDVHARRIGRLAKRAVAAFDGDEAGQRASREAVVRLLGVGLKTLVAALGSGEDPDSYCRRAGTAALNKAIDEAVSAVEYFIEQAFSAKQMTVEERAEAARSLAPLLAALGPGLERDLYMAQLAEKVGVSVEQLSHHMAKGAPRAEPQSKKAPDPAPRAAAAASHLPTRFELGLLRDLLLFPQLRPRLGELAEYASDPMRVLLEELATSETPFLEVIKGHVDDARLLETLARIEPDRGATPEELGARAEQTFCDVLNRLKVRRMEATQKEWLRLLQQAQADDDEDSEELQRRIANLTRRKRELKRPGSMA